MVQKVYMWKVLSDWKYMYTKAQTLRNFQKLTTMNLGKQINQKVIKSEMHWSSIVVNLGGFTVHLGSMTWSTSQEALQFSTYQDVRLRLLLLPSLQHSFKEFLLNNTHRDLGHQILQYSLILFDIQVWFNVHLKSQSKRGGKAHLICW